IGSVIPPFYLYVAALCGTIPTKGNGEEGNAVMIDSHQHVFWHGRDDAGLIADMDAQGIDLAWLLSWEVLPHEDEAVYHGVLNPAHRRVDGTHPGIPLSDLLLARAHYPERFVVGYCPHPLIGNAA